MDLVFCYGLNYGPPLQPSSGLIDGSHIGYLLQSLGLLYVDDDSSYCQPQYPPENKVTWLLIAVIPVFGSLLYLMFGERRLSEKGNDPAEKIWSP